MQKKVEDDRHADIQKLIKKRKEELLSESGQTKSQFTVLPKKQKIEKSNLVSKEKSSPKSSPPVPYSVINKTILFEKSNLGSKENTSSKSSTPICSSAINKEVLRNDSTHPEIKGMKHVNHVKKKKDELYFNDDTCLHSPNSMERVNDTTTSLEEQIENDIFDLNHSEILRSSNLIEENNNTEIINAKKDRFHLNERQSSANSAEKVSRSEIVLDKVLPVITSEILLQSNRITTICTNFNCQTRLLRAEEMVSNLTRLLNQQLEIVDEQRIEIKIEKEKNDELQKKIENNLDEFQGMLIYMFALLLLFITIIYS